MLSGHNLPIFFARELGEDFAYCAAHGLVGTSFDSLTGQYAAQGPNLYMLARLHDDPTVPVQEVLDEYYAGFGPAEADIRRYFGLWEEVAGRYTEALCARINTHWVNFYVDADAVFTPQVMARARSILRAARAAAGQDAEVAGRVAFLAKGLRHAELTMATQKAHRAFLRDRDFAAYGAALRRLDRYRRGLEGDMVSNLAYLNCTEGYTWGRRAAQLLRQPHEQLPDQWQFAWDPDRRGETESWFAPGHDASGWASVNVRGCWDTQEVGKSWKAEHGADYTGAAWYRTGFTAPAEVGQPWLVFGAVAQSCQVWVNGQLVLSRPSPIWGSPDAWQQPFVADVSKAVRAGERNVVVVRAESASGSGGIWQPVWVAYQAAPG
jgi:hypothetical protein